MGGFRIPGTAPNETSVADAWLIKKMNARTVKTAARVAFSSRMLSPRRLSSLRYRALDHSVLALDGRPD